MLLVGLLGDTPARTKFGGFVGHGGHVGCPYCVMNAVSCVGFRQSYWKGFHTPSSVHLQKVGKLSPIMNGQLTNSGGIL